MTTKEITKVFIFLDNLRESGITNMFGARPYVIAEFGYSKDKAGKVLTEWMRTFGGGTTTPSKRAKEARVVC